MTSVVFVLEALEQVKKPPFPYTMKPLSGQYSIVLLIALSTILCPPNNSLSSPTEPLFRAFNPQYSIGD
jgi:hypothetical protein